MTISSEALQYGCCIWYPVQFRNNKIKVLFYSNNEVNAMILSYVAKLDLISGKRTVVAQKIDELVLKTHRIVTAGFLVYDKLNKAWFFEKLSC